MISKPPHSTPRVETSFRARVEDAYGDLAPRAPSENDAIAAALGLAPEPDDAPATADEVDGDFVRTAILNAISLLEYRIRMRRATDKDITALDKALQLCATFAKQAEAVNAVQNWKAPLRVVTTERSADAKTVLSNITAEIAKARK